MTSIAELRRLEAEAKRLLDELRKGCRNETIVRSHHVIYAEEVLSRILAMRNALPELLKELEAALRSQSHPTEAAMSVENLISQLRDAAKFTLANTLYSQAADKLEELAAENEATRQDIERYIQINTDLMAENERLRQALTAAEQAEPDPYPKRTKAQQEAYESYLEQTRRPFLAALEPAEPATDAEPVSAIEYVMRFGGRCRDCADANGICENRYLPCDPDEGRRAVSHVISALKYGIDRGYIASPFPRPPEDRLREALEGVTLGRCGSEVTIFCSDSEEADKILDFLILAQEDGR